MRPVTAPDPRLAPPWPATLGPFELRSRDGAFSLQPGLSLQLRYQHESKEGSDGAWQGENRAELRRVRPSLRGKLLSSRLAYALQLSTAPGSVELIDAYLDFRFHPQLSLRAGQAKIPFTRYRIGSYKDLTFTDWSILTGYLGAERQLGLTLHNGYERPPRFEYELGVFTGLNARASHALGLSRLFGELIENPSSLVDGGPTLALHPELVAHLAFNSAGMTTATDSDFERGPLRFSAGLSLAWDLRPDPLIDLAMRLAPELLLKYRGASFSTVFYLAFARQGDTVLEQHLVFSGALWQASYLVQRWLELAIRYSLLDVNDQMADQARARASGIVGAAAADAGALKAQYRNAGQIRSEQELTFGINVYLIGSCLKWQNDFSWTRAGRSDGDRDSFRYRSQLQLSF